MTFTSDEQALLQIDTTLGKYIELHGTLPLSPARPYYEALANSIISQQISVKAAAKIFERFKNITGLKPETFLTLQENDIKTIGLSGQKSRYIYDLSLQFVQDSAVYNHLDTLSDDEVINELTKIKGVGVWTAQMFLIFTLHRSDIFAPNDRGLQIAIKEIYELTELPSNRALEQFAEDHWAPYRTTASLHLWHSLDNTPNS